MHKIFEGRRKNIPRSDGLLCAMSGRVGEVEGEKLPEFCPVGGTPGMDEESTCDLILYVCWYDSQTSFCRTKYTHHMAI